MNMMAEQLARCDREIAQAIARKSEPHTEAEYVTILRCEIDWQLERKRILSQMALEAAA